MNVNYDDVADQLQLDSESKPFNIIWVACSGRGTVVKVDTITGKVLGEYRSSPSSHGLGDPSRTTVDKDGSVWLTNRKNIGPNGYGTIVHIALEENNQCEDRNGNGVIDTSTGLGDIKNWTDASGTRNVSTAADECIVHYTEVNSGGTRHVSIDENNDVWVGGVDPRNFDLVKGGRFDEPGSGTIIRSEQSVGFGGYGGLMDGNGVIWSAYHLLRWDTANPLTGDNGDPDPDPSDPSGYNIGPPKAGTNWAGQEDPFSYGLCIDSLGNVWSTQNIGGLIHKYAPDGRHLGQFSHNYSDAQGCVVDKNNDVWVAHSWKGSSVGHIKNDGSPVGTVTVGNGPTGVAVDGMGKVWSTNKNSNTLSRIDPTLNDGVGGVDLTVNLTVELGPSCSPYNYGDMTGSTTIAPPDSGSWIVIHDSGAASTDWGRIEWNADVPSDSVLTVRVRGDEGSAWVPVTNGAELSGLTGQYLHVQVLFQRATTGESPVLYDLSIINNEPPELPLACVNVTVDFSKGANDEQLEGGTYVDNQWEAFGMVLSSTGGLGSRPRLFNTSNVGNGMHGDPDLGSPHKLCTPSGPGVGSGGRPGALGENCEPLGNVLIIQEDNDDTSIPDDNAGGGSIFFNFVKEAAFVYEIGFLDLDESATVTVDHVTSLGMEETIIDLPMLGPNAVQIETINIANVEQITVDFAASAAVTFISFCYNP